MKVGPRSDNECKTRASNAGHLDTQSVDPINANISMAKDGKQMRQATLSPPI